MKLTKYWYISLVVLFSCQNGEINTIEEVQNTKKDEVFEIKADSLLINEKPLKLDSISIEKDTVFIDKKEIIKKTTITQKKETTIIDEMDEPDESYKFPKEKYYRFIKSQKFYDDSVAFYSWFMRSEHWRKEYGYPDSAEYHKRYLTKWAGRIRSIKSDYDWSE